MVQLSNNNLFCILTGLLFLIILVKFINTIREGVCPKSNDPQYGDRVATALNKRIAIQNNEIQDIEKEIKDIDSRYPILFQTGNVEIDSGTPSLMIDGSIKFITLNLKIPPPPDGEDGDPGPQGVKGVGIIGPVGSKGESGYWGQEGVDKPIFMS